MHADVQGENAPVTGPVVEHPEDQSPEDQFPEIGSEGHTEDWGKEEEGFEEKRTDQAYPEGSELGQIKALFEREQASRNFEIVFPGYNGQFVAVCKPVSEGEWKMIEKKLDQAGKRDKNALRNMKLDTLISGIVDVHVAANEDSQPGPLHLVAPEIVGTDDQEVRFGDPRLQAFLSVLGKPDCKSARSQLLVLLKHEPIRLNNFFTDYYEVASGESDLVAQELQGE